MTANIEELSNEELFAIVNESSTDNFDDMSNEELAAIAGVELPRNVSRREKIKQGIGNLASEAIPETTRVLGKAVPAIPRAVESLTTPENLLNLPLRLARGALSLSGLENIDEDESLGRPASIGDLLENVINFISSGGEQVREAEELSGSIGPTALIRETAGATGDVLQDLVSRLVDEPQTAPGRVAGAAIENLPFGPRGAIFGGIEQIVKELGADPDAALFAGMLGAGLAPENIPGRVARTSPRVDGPLAERAGIENVPSVAEKVHGIGPFFERGVAARPAAEKIGRLGKAAVDQISESLSEITPTELVDVGRISGEEINAQLRPQAQDSILRRVSIEKLTPQETGIRVQDSINERFNEIQTQKRAAYEAAENAYKDLTFFPERSFKSAKSLLNDLTRVETLTAEQKATISQLRSALSDLGVGELGARPVQVSNMVDLMRNMQDFADYEGVVPRQKNRIKEVVKTIRSEIDEALLQRPEAKALFDAANEIHRNQSAIYGKDAVIKLRKSEVPEDLSTLIQKPSQFQQIKVAIPEESGVRSTLERQLLESVKPEKFREFSTDLSLRGRSAANDLKKIADPLSKEGARLKNQESILNQVVDIGQTGEVSPALIARGKTIQGFNDVESVLKKTAQGRQILESYKQVVGQSLLNDMMTNEKFDFKKANKILKDRNKRPVLEKVGLDPQFLSELERYSSNISKNIDQIQRRAKESPLKRPVTLGKLLGLGILNLFVPLPVIEAASGLVVGSGFAIRGLYNILTSKPIQRSIRSLGRKNARPNQFIQKAEILSDQIEAIAPGLVGAGLQEQQEI